MTDLRGGPPDDAEAALLCQAVDECCDDTDVDLLLSHDHDHDDGDPEGVA
jgi:hypothetical protein